MPQVYQFLVGKEAVAKRLDAYLAENMPSLSRSQVKKIIEGGFVTVNNCAPKVAQKLKENDTVQVSLPAPKPLETKPENIPLNVLHEDEDIIVINKPAGMVVHPAPGNYAGTLVNALLYHCPSLTGIGGVIRPGIVHRLDKGTSGTLVVAKNDLSHQTLSSQFKKHTIFRLYHCLVYGTMESDQGIVALPIGRDISHRKKMSVRTKKGRESVTNWKMLKGYRDFSWLEIKPETGRTHQIRVHLSGIGHPVVGDPVYGGVSRLANLKDKSLMESIKKLNRPILHASVLGFHHPRTKEYLEFTAPLPTEIQEILDIIQ
ncbi:MAG: RluA family pseudouridine synthase [Proteobacteria bacterium]|nr:RluA family pseudouridine synthase [Pseudomonadota bacterium]